ncbi:6,7-dimethyl-8-ribityllumazine synthase, beta subunit [Candidatus Hydrogenisulfobacillus filiaventi]|uniref:6,7-dimethyl-8-ribityllumazine synthase n=1 Tax=Candidatus Hydrogenisulfobacillus filiaventi TaxID=2707344 RepID=A0A6F8ZJ99_9FIRM|nr:6,7-dimethyl-8-ribityllumazine synthase [Bacillota bacterium]CAB1130014.1 6,7-dimethyl-8-ribityllumazine synthase, beta subunit [Candidatus Hydrogenisulfobacillus filiaventi]
MAEYQGLLTARPGQRWAVVVSRFNRRVTDRLLAGALDTLSRHGVRPEAVDVVWVPGSFEIPAAVRRLTERSYAAIITLGAIIRGETPHFDFIAGATTAALAELNRTAPMPVIFGILTTNTVEEAENRADGKMGNKGAEAAAAALEMADLLASLAGA